MNAKWLSRLFGLKLCEMCGSVFDVRITHRKIIAIGTYCDHCVEAGREQEMAISRLADDLMYIKRHPDRLHELVTQLRAEDAEKAKESANMFKQYVAGMAAQQSQQDIGGIQSVGGWPRGGI